MVNKWRNKHRLSVERRCKITAFCGYGKIFMWAINLVYFAELLQFTQNRVWAICLIRTIYRNFNKKIT